MAPFFCQPGALEGSFMPTLERSDGWAASGTVDVLQMSLNVFLRKHRMRVIGKQPGETHVRQGFPRLARWLRGRFMLQRWLPKRAQVRLHPDDHGVAVRACIEDGYTLPALSPRLQNKYRRYFDWWMSELRKHIA
jgi:hypothetical protein